MIRAIVFVVTLIVASQATATGMCYDRRWYGKFLEKRYGERLVAQGLNGLGSIAEVFASPSGSWTIVETFPNGRTCLVTSGTHFTQYPINPKPGRPL